ncbi:hypothetical protein KGG70_gp15 [Streptomyces phage Celia]|uniref:Uncharacterized protein n=1 Tax=Streptomyces phage Celia TaxID=2590946 RepID=A0A516KRF3_9CAUD|nr:hypothetical protein KGG70_gp15 [Streptomyces phage Celia]QDP44269.1 hypothetical protein SEA_CELIA_66 [Streptomyces phage Celia]QFG10531.1 hypothetical protein SEA_URZA_68 [Streptomyces phage Urza]
MFDVKIHHVRNMAVIEKGVLGESAVDLIVQGPASQKNRGAHAAWRIARETLAKALGFSPEKISQSYHFDREAGTYTFVARYSTAL